MKFICEDRDGKIYVRGKCCLDRTSSTREFREDYSGWIIEDLDIPNPNVLSDEDGRLLYEVVNHKAIKAPSELTAKEQAAKDRKTPEEEIEILKARLDELEKIAALEVMTYK